MRITLVSEITFLLFVFHRRDQLLVSGSGEENKSEYINGSDFVSYNDSKDNGNNSMLELGGGMEVMHLFKCPGSNISSEEVYSIPITLFEPHITDNSSVKVRFDQERTPNCPQEKLQELHVDIRSPSEDDFVMDQRWLSITHNETVSESVAPEKFCFSSLDEDTVTVKFCRSNCNEEPCISKCCYAHEICNVEHGSCECTESSHTKWLPTLNSIRETGYSFIHHGIQCDGPNDQPIYNLNMRSNLNSSFHIKKEIQILNNGSVSFKRKDGVWITFPEGSYCLDGASIPNSDGSLDFSGDLEDMVLYVCLRNEKTAMEPEKQEKFILYKILIPFATGFIILTILIYFLTWSAQTIHGYTVSLYLITLLFLYIFLIVTSIPSLARSKEHPGFCPFIAAAIHFLYLSSICWLTSISFDVWRNFRFMKRAIEPAAARRRGMRRFIFFCIFSFGYPLLHVGICAALDAKYRNVEETKVPLVLPKYGLGSSYCTISNEGLTYHLYIPVGILLGCNILLFCATIVTIAGFRKNIRGMFSSVSRTRSDSNGCNNEIAVNQSFGTYMRLFIIMGIFWIVQFITWFLPIQKSSSSIHETESTDIIVAVTDALTVLQAVIIFYIFVCKKSVFVKLWNLQPWLRPVLYFLFIRGGCCTTPSPPPDPRKSSAFHHGTLQGKVTLRDNKVYSGEQRISTESNLSDIMNSRRKTILTSEDRKTSSTSNSTEMSDVDSIVRGSWNSEKSVRMAVGKTETTF